MPEEISEITKMLDNRSEIELGGRTYHKGTINGQQVIVVFSRWGKVAAATTATTLLLSFRATELIFTGVAGAVSPLLNIGDIVIGKRFFQHDMDCSPILPRFEIPLLGLTHIVCSDENLNRAQLAAERALHRHNIESIIMNSRFVNASNNLPRVFIGDIASGDKFVSSTRERKAIAKALPSVLCVEMEGAAVAQVCYEQQVPFTIIRTISDVADESAHIDFQTFINDVSSKIAAQVIREMFF